MVNTQTQSKKFNQIYFFLLLIIFCGCFGHANNYRFNLFLVIILLLLCLLRFLVDLKHKNNKYKYAFKYFLWYSAFIIFNIISLKWTINGDYSIDLIRDLISTFLFVFTIVLSVNNKEKLDSTYKCIIFACLYMCIRLLIFDYDVRFTDDFGNSIGLYFNRLALILNYGICICIYFIVKKKKISYLSLVILFYYIIFLTGSRKSLIFTPLFVFIFFLMNGKFNIKKIFKNILILFIAFLSVMLLINTNESLKNEMVDLYQSIVYNTSTTDGSINERNYYKKTAYHLFKENPIYGIGSNGFRGYLNSIHYRHVTYSHCNYLELLATLGIIGFILYYLLYFKAIINCLKNFNRNSLEKVLVLAFFIVEIVIEYGFVSFYFFEFQIVIALMYIMSCLYKDGGDYCENSNYNTIS